ncbi:Hypoxanthine-guanine phosphoribosyltransferase [Listeria monocytogenes]|nr:Hypoxanthine-guanine phosphoribosyltransferase [Listeria monocytogenes]
MVVSSYHGGTTSSGEVKILKDVDTNIEGRDVIFIEDIIDTGRTLKYLRDMFAENYRNLPYVGVLKEEIYSK